MGIVAEVDLGTENLRWMGSARFTYGFFVRVLGKTVYACDLAVKIEIPDKSAIREHYRNELRNCAPIEERRGLLPSGQGDNGLPPLRYGSISAPLPSTFTTIQADKLGNFCSGNMALMAPGANIFPATVPSDGNLDLGGISRTSAIKSFRAVENGNLFSMPHVNYRKISGYRITPEWQKAGYISIDGERVPFNLSKPKSIGAWELCLVEMGFCMRQRVWCLRLVEDIEGDGTASKLVCYMLASMIPGGVFRKVMA